MNLESLQLFLQLSRSLHFARASRECHVSASALSRTVQRLEQELGAELFVRDNRKVELTAAGVRLQRFASETLSGLARLRQELARQRAELTGTLTLFCSVTASHSVLPQVLTRFRAAHPEVTIRLETGYAASALDMLEAGSVDLTVAALPRRVPRGLLSRVITTTPLLFVAPNSECEVSAMVERDPIDWSQVPMILPEFGIARRSVDHWFRARGLTPKVYGEVQGNEAQLSLISLGCGVGVVPALVMEKSPLVSSVRPVAMRPRLPAFRVGICTKRSNLKSSIVSAFWESISSDGSAMA